MKLVKVIKNFFLGIFILIIIALLFQFVVNVKYSFPEPHAFKGDYLFNPYRGIENDKWRMANFHAHARLYLGLTNGATNRNSSLDSLYRYFGYSIISISNYQNINTFERKNKWYVPVYEHGYQYYKNHQLVINAKKVSWLDYFFRQSLNNKQFVIDQLKKDTTVILTIVHPILRKAYSYDDLRYLSNYNCLEIANHERQFSAFYDTILSAGHPVFIMADDDTHDLKKLDENAHCFNLVNTDLVKDSIIYALKTGRSIGVQFNLSSYKTNEEKKAALQRLPEITGITLLNDTLSVRLNQPVKTIKFIGQYGIEKKVITNCALGTYLFSKRDTYIRTEIECKDGTVYFLNPVFRYDGKKLTDYTPSYNVAKTWYWRSVVFAILIFIIIIRYYKKVNV